MRIPIAARALCAGLLLASAGCGGNGSTSHTTSTPRPTATAATTPTATAASWAARTEQLCVQKRAAIARLGYVNITYAGIARVGLPAVKGSLDGYFGRLLAVLREFSRRQRELTTPPALVATMGGAASLDQASQVATVQARRRIAAASSPAALSAAFRAWTDILGPLTARGDAVARQLNLRACRSGAAPSMP